MKQAIRCPHCSSIFRAYEFDLNKAQGWVRCGICEHIFQGNDHGFNWSSESFQENYDKKSGIQPMPDIDLNLPQIFDFPSIDTKASRTERAPPLEELVRIIPGTDKPLLTEQFHKPNKIITHYILKFIKYFTPRLTLLTLILAFIAQLGYYFRYQIFSEFPWLYNYQIPNTQYSLRVFCQVYECQLDPIKKINSLNINLSPIEFSFTKNLENNKYTTLLHLNGNIHSNEEINVKLPEFELTLKDQDDQIISRKILTHKDLNIAEDWIRHQERIKFSVKFQLFIKDNQEIKTYSITPFYR
jgi:predicted Zn finger-like uncharacterized protein